MYPLGGVSGLSPRGTVYYMVNVSKRQGIERGGVVGSSPNGDSLLHGQRFKKARYRERRDPMFESQWGQFTICSMFQKSKI